MKNSESPIIKSPNITREDVVRALGDTDPNKTNATLLRDIIGHGSPNTVQKHLDAIRTEREKPILLLQSAVPDIPSGLVASIWSAAWSEARAQTLAKIDQVTAERDAFRNRVDTLMLDKSVLGDAYDKLEAEQEHRLSEFDRLELTIEASEEAHVAALTEVQTLLELARDQLAQRDAAMSHAAELARRDAELKDAAHDRAVQRLLDQIAELKSVLHATNGQKLAARNWESTGRPEPKVADLAADLPG